MIKIGVIGTGNIGKRHIQSIGNMGEEKEVFCYDIFEQSLDSMDQFLDENNIKINKFTKFNELDDFLNYIDSETIIIIATTAKGRIELIRKTSNKNPKFIIAEKPVSQKLSEYEELFRVYNKDIPVHVNFPRHCYKVYNSLLEKLKHEKIKSIKINMGNAGFCCNGIHMLDLIIWLLDGKEYEITDYEIFKTYETKRKGFSDFSGNLKFLINNTICELNDTEDNPTEYIQITTENKTFNIDEPNQKLTETEGDSVMNMDFEVPFQSQLTSEVVKAIIWNGDIMIPDLKQSFLSHKILFEFMEKVDVSGLNIT